MEKIIRHQLTPSNLHLREIDGEGESRIIEGYAILFNVESEPLWKDEYGEAREVIDSGAITEELLRDSDIKMTMFHDRQLILARSNKGKGTLSWAVDEKGVSFSFESPNTVDGDKAIELVKRGDISGCSFAFSTYYGDEEYVQRATTYVNGYSTTIYRVMRALGVYDFTLAADPCYSDTNCKLREVVEEAEAKAREKSSTAKRQIDEMRKMYNLKKR